VNRKTEDEKPEVEVVFAAANHDAQVNVIRALLQDKQEAGVEAMLAAGMITEEQIRIAKL